MGLTEKPIVDIKLDGIDRTRFRINGDSNAIIELDLSDLNISDRLEKGLTQLDEYVAELAKLPKDDENLSNVLKDVDNKMRESIDYIFSYPVSEVCAKYGTMFDLKDGKFRYESIIDGLTKLYTNNLNEEYKKLNNRIKKHTAKYTAKTNKKVK